MAVLAREPERCRKYAHRPHELIHRDAAKHRDVLEYVFRQQLALCRRLNGAGLTADERYGRRPHDRRAHGTPDNLSRSKPHVASDTIVPILHYDLLCPKRGSLPVFSRGAKAAPVRMYCPPGESVRSPPIRRGILRMPTKFPASHKNTN